jgi:hypothetical protein
MKDRDGATPLLTRMRRTCLHIALTWADSAYGGPCNLTPPRVSAGELMFSEDGGGDLHARWE